MKNILFSAAAATFTSVNAITVPIQYALNLQNLIPVVNATIQTQGPYYYGIEVTSPNNLAFTTTCT